MMSKHGTGCVKEVIHALSVYHTDKSFYFYAHTLSCAYKKLSSNIAIYEGFIIAGNNPW